MIQFNLLPDIKLEYLKTERTKRLVFSISVIVAGISLAIILLLFAALELQSHQVNNNNDQIKKLSSQLTSNSDTNKILTIQNQLNTIVSLYNAAPKTTRIYDFLPQLVPQNVFIGHTSLDFSLNKMEITGTASSLESVNTFADTLKFANYTTGQGSTKKPAFTSVVLNSFGRDPSSATYSFTMIFDPGIFDRTKDVKLDIPSNYISTRSFTQLPSSNLFNGDNSQSNQNNPGGAPSQ